jgi:xylulokinase
MGTPVVAGGSDQSAQAIGMGAIQPGIIALTLGTSGVVFASTNKPIIEPDGLLHAFCHAIPERWHLMGVMLSAAGSLQWYHDAVFPEMEFSNLLTEAEKIPAGSEGLLFLPYLSGERTPHPDPLARGAFIGLTIRHKRAHMTRAVLEGVAFGIRDGFELLKSTGIGEVKQVRVSGGGAKSSLWRSILSNVLNLELVTVNTTEGAAYGAALLAGVGIDIWPNVDDAVNATIVPGDSSKPETKMIAEYEHYYQVFKQLYPTLKDLFPLLARASDR